MKRINIVCFFSKGKVKRAKGVLEEVVVEFEINAKRKKGRPRKLCKECVQDLEGYGLTGQDAYDRQKLHERIKKLINPTSTGNGIKTDVAVVACFFNVAV